MNYLGYLATWIICFKWTKKMDEGDEYWAQATTHLKIYKHLSEGLRISSDKKAKKRASMKKKEKNDQEWRASVRNREKKEEGGRASVKEREKTWGHVTHHLKVWRYSHLKTSTWGCITSAIRKHIKLPLTRVRISLRPWTKTHLETQDHLPDDACTT